MTCSINALTDSMQGNQCIAVLRSQLGFGGERPRKLNEFVAAVLENRKFYNLIVVARFPKRSAEYFANQLEFVRENYGKVTSHEEFAEQSFFCSAFVVACYAVVGIIGETAQAAYQPNNFSPGHLGKTPHPMALGLSCARRWGLGSHATTSLGLEVGRRVGDRRYS